MKSSALAPRPLVCVVDDDESVREALPDLLGELGFAAEAFASAREFLASDRLEQTRCLLADIAMPEMTGPQLHQELQRSGYRIPVVFISAHMDEGVRRQLLGQGASACLAKPFSDTALLDAVTAALSSTSSPG